MNNNIFNPVKFRQKLHQYPELSGKEKKTANIIFHTLKQFNPDKLILNIGGHGIIAVFNGKTQGKTIMFRADIDAIPISESNNIPHASQHSGISHKCGHDGHTAILINLASQIEPRNFQGRVILLFQPAEETGEGAAAVLNDPKFSSYKPDLCFSFHNIPGYSIGQILTKDKVFSFASCGLDIKITGSPSHACQPEKGNNPALAMSTIINKLMEIPKNPELISKSSLITITHAKLGQPCFGTSPGAAQIMATLRSSSNKDMLTMKNKTEKIVQDITQPNNLSYKLEWRENFPATLNNEYANKIIINAAQHLKLSHTELSIPFSWSEDFAHFTNKFKGAIFGIGAGEKHPPLHTTDYDFPDEIIHSTTKLLKKIIHICQKS